MKNQDQDYGELFAVLQDQKLGIDLFKKALHNSTWASKLEGKLEKANVKSGMIDRLMTDFESWYTEYVKDFSIDRHGFESSRVKVQLEPVFSIFYLFIRLFMNKRIEYKVGMNKLQALFISYR